MSSKYPEYKNLNLTNIANQIQALWDKENTFEKSINSRPESNPFVFFEGPPSSNGMPGIHHVMGRSIKDVFCRYKTLKGFQVNRKAGWDTHGLPVELGVEKELGITKEDIGKEISIEDYNAACKKAVMKYTNVWNDLTKKMGYWVDMEKPYITYESKYMESIWWLLAQLHKKNLLYKGYTIQPYSPAAGTGLSSHEINQPGCYKNVKDTTVVAQFKALKNNVLPENTYFLAWTTTPWTLRSNTALAVGPKIDYLLVKTFNQYTKNPVNVVVAKNLLNTVFNANFYQVDDAKMVLLDEANKKVPFFVEKAFIGNELIDIKYEQLLPFAQPCEKPENAFRVIPGNFVTTEDGTGIVHIAPTFGQDDALVAKEADIPALLVFDDAGNKVPLVNLQGKFRSEMGKFAGKFVKNEFYPKDESPDKSIDVEIAIKLKEENKAFNVAKYEHSYPHCWRTDKPVLYYPLDSWFIKVSEVKDKFISLNKKINWKPESTGTGRFGNWLENANDWNLSRSRFWGTPIPIWRTEDGSEEICIDSIEQLKNECEKAVVAGFMKNNPLNSFKVDDMSEENYALVDLHKNHVDSIILVSDSGKPMKREADLIDVWFDSGSMPYAQWHYPFENKALIDDNKTYPADFIAEGVDQTRGWFYTLHAISAMCFDSVAYKNVVSNGLVLDKSGQKMSKRIGNVIDPFETLETFGPDATRWYMLTNAQPWDNLRFNLEGITEVQRKFFGTLYNTYGFFALYANLDLFQYKEDEIPLSERPEIDRWILSKLNSLIKEVDFSLDSYEPTKAGRAIQHFVIDQLSNWYVRLCRRRFWKGEYTKDKLSAYQTLYTCLEVIARLSSPIAPFFSDRLFRDLNIVTNKQNVASVHLSDFPKYDPKIIDIDLEERMEIAQRVCSLVLGLRKKEKIKVRQPLQKIMVPAINEKFKKQLKSVEKLILSELNVKELEVLSSDSNVIKKKVKPNFKSIGPKYGKQMKAISAMINKWGDDEISNLESSQKWVGVVNDQEVELLFSDFEIQTADVPGFLVATENEITVALDVQITDELINEGIARDFVNRIQNLRKEYGFNVTDRINIRIISNDKINRAINNNLNYICSETLAESLDIVSSIDEKPVDMELGNGLQTECTISKIN